MSKELPPVSELSKLLLCDYDSGELLWKHRPDEYFSSPKWAAYWNRRYAGKRAIYNMHKYGYFEGCLLGVNVKAHRVIWAMYYGAWPEGQIDHINGNRSDNRIRNLRDVSSAENGRNQRRHSTNTSGYCGVRWHKRDMVWNADIRVDGKLIHLGTFRCITSAAIARALANEKYGFHHNHGNDPVSKYSR